MSVIGRVAPFIVGGASFNPVTLFAGGEKGAIYTPWDFSTLFQDNAGSTPVTATGQSVGKMLDISGNGYHVIQATGSKRPTIQQDGSGNYYLQGDGSDDVLACASFTLNSPNLYVCAGAKTPAVGQNFSRIFSCRAAAVPGDFAVWTAEAAIIRNSGSATWGTYRNGSLRATVAVTDGSLGIIETGATASGSFAALNGGTDSTASAAAGSDFAITQFAMLNATDDSGPSSARFHGGLLISRIPTSTERANIVAYFNAKTGAF